MRMWTLAWVFDVRVRSQNPLPNTEWDVARKMLQFARKGAILDVWCKNSIHYEKPELKAACNNRG
jgi:hypothetical protein